MYPSSHEENKFAELAQQGLQSAEQRMHADPTVKAAVHALDAARQKALADPTSDEGVLAVEAAQKAYNKATNAFHRREYLAGLAAKQAEQDRVADEAAQKFAREQEEAAKADFQASWARANGTLDGFEEAWAKRWPAEKERRAAEEQNALRQRMATMIGYPF